MYRRCLLLVMMMIPLSTEKFQLPPPSSSSVLQLIRLRCDEKRLKYSRFEEFAWIGRSRMLLLLAISLTVVGTSVLSHPAHVKYDQRQEGKVNVRTDFENFVILVISPSQKGSIPSTLGGGAGGANDLLDFIFTRANAAVRKNKRKHSKPEAVSGNETEAFIESKTAPYHVDISKSNLAKLHPADEDGNGDKVLVSPKIALLRNKKRRRMSRAYVLSVPGEETVLLLRKNRKLKEKAVEAGTKKEKLSLLGAEFEQCGPGYERDAQGICKSSKNN